MTKAECVICWLVCTGPPDQTKNDADLKFRIHTPGFFVFFEKVTLSAASLEKTAASRGFSLDLLDCIVLILFIKFSL